MLRIIAFFVALVTGLSAASPALAGKKDDAWAQCLLESAPKSVANWLKLPAGERRLGLERPSPEFLLRIRLQAACHTRLIVDGKKFPPSFDGKKVRESLAKMQQPQADHDIVEPRAFQCTRFFLNDTEMKAPAAYSWGFGDFDTGTIFSSVQFMFAASGGGSVGLPDTGGLKKCQLIDENGMLMNA